MYKGQPIAVNKGTEETVLWDTAPCGGHHVSYISSLSTVPSRILCTSNNSREKNTAAQVTMLEAANYYYNSHHPIKTLLSHDAVIINQLKPVLPIYGATSDI